MIKLQKYLLLCKILLFIGLGLFLITNNSVMAMNNGHVQQNNGNINNELTACRNLHDLLLQEARLMQELYNNLMNNVPEQTITNLKQQANEIAIQAENIRRNIYPNQQP